MESDFCLPAPTPPPHHPQPPSAHLLQPHSPRRTLDPKASLKSCWETPSESPPSKQSGKSVCPAKNTPDLITSLLSVAQTGTAGCWSLGVHGTCGHGCGPALTSFSPQMLLMMELEAGLADGPRTATTPLGRI